MPAYSTWQPTEGKIPPIASADQSATRRLVDPRGDLMRGKPIVSTLLGVFGGPSDPTVREARPPSGSPFLVPPPAPAGLVPHGSDRSRTRQSFPSRSGRSPSTCGAVVGLFTRIRNRPDRPFRPNDSARFQEMFVIEGCGSRPIRAGSSTLAYQIRRNRGIIAQCCANGRVSHRSLDEVQVLSLFTPELQLSTRLSLDLDCVWTSGSPKNSD